MIRRSVVVSLAALLVAGSTVAGNIFTSRTTVEGGPGAAQQASTVKAWVSGNSAKVVFEESGNPMMKAGTYLLSKDGGNTAYLVNPKDKTYMKWDMGSMMQFAGGMMKAISMKVSEPKVERLGQEPGGDVAGVPTTLYRYRTSYTMTMSIFGMKQSTRTVTEEEIWAAPKLVELAMGLWLRKSPPKTGDEAFDKLIDAEMAKVEGFPLKRRTVRTTTDAKGKVEKSTMVMEVLSLESASVPDSTFEMPAGYKETSLLDLGGKGGNPFLGQYGGE